MTGHHGMWQYTSGGTVGGIAGKVDMNIAYRDFPKLIKARDSTAGAPGKAADQAARKKVPAESGMIGWESATVWRMC